MPYIITTTTEHPHEDGGFYAEVTRRAVATLDEAREAALDAVWTQEYTSRDPEPDLDAARNLPDHGGTVGPLPDGTVIEVERVDDLELVRLIRVEAQHDMQGFLTGKIIDAYNAAQEAGR